jgi:biopolymer transport protein ExbB/TolQ
MVLQLQVWAFWLLQEAEGISFDPRSVWNNMGYFAKGIVFILFIMSAWSIGVMIDRVLAYNAARKQSRAFAPAVAGALREGKLDEAIKIADRFNKSHLAKVVVAGLQEFKAGNHRFHSTVCRIAGNGYGHHERVQIDLDFQVDRYWRSCRRYFRSPDHHGSRFVRGYSGCLDVQLLQQPH